VQESAGEWVPETAKTAKHPAARRNRAARRRLPQTYCPTAEAEEVEVEVEVLRWTSTWTSHPCSLNSYDPLCILFGGAHLEALRWCARDRRRNVDVLHPEGVLK
jgi:hypothetical protein